MTLIDLRSDTVTRPTDKMRQTMIDAPVGDDVYKEDPTVNLLEKQDRCHHRQKSGTFLHFRYPVQSVSSYVPLPAGDEFIVGQTAHAFKYEAGGAAILGSIQPHTVES